MGPIDVIAALRHVLGRASVEPAAVVLADEAATWPVGAVDVLGATGLLVPADNDRALHCDGCEEGCLVTPTWRRPPEGPARLVHPCHRPREIGLVELDPARLRRWRVDLDRFAVWLAGASGVVGRATVLAPGERWRLGERTIGGTRRTLLLARAGGGVEAIVEPGPAVLTLADAPRPAIPVVSLVVIRDGGLALDDGLLEAALGRTRRTGRAKPLDLAPGTRWEQVIVRVIEDELVEVVTPDRAPLRLGPDDFGLRDGRDGTPTEGWTTLLVLARGGGEIAMGDAGSRDELVWRVGMLRKALDATIPAEGKPIPDYRKAGGRWRTTFALSDLRPADEFSRSPVRR